MPDLTPERALIFRITHIRNVPWLLRNGVCCRSCPDVDPDFVEIGNPDLIARRPHRQVPIPPGGNLSDYTPFYFTPHSPMLYNILTGYTGIRQRTNSAIVILVSSLRRIAEQELPFVFTDRHAYLIPAKFYDDLDALDQIDWKILTARDFKKDLNDLGKVERYQAEALVHGRVPIAALLGIVCAGEDPEAELNRMVAESGAEVKIANRPEWYF